jgi:hypothetical protein
VIVDGDDTYFAEDVQELLRPIQEDRADMVVGDRLHAASRDALNDLHRFGNRTILRIINLPSARASRTCSPATARSTATCCARCR